jgi:GTPase SAR1 family protein
MAMENQKILVWGLSGVGKTTFINALPRELSLFPEAGLRFEMHGELPVLEPTQHGDELDYKFKVSDQKGIILKEYFLGIYDDKGDSMKNALLDIDNDTFILSYVKSSKGIIAILDPIMLLNNPAQRQELVKLIQNLLKILNQRNDHPSLALCLNKMDVLQTRWGSPETVFEMCFDSSWGAIKSNIASSKNVLIELFLVSATGFVRDNMYREFPNFSGAGIAVEDRWRPWNASAPFFWIFNNLDKPSPSPWFSLWSKSEVQPYPLPFF